MRMFDLGLPLSLFDGSFAETNIHHRIPKSQTKNREGGYPIRIKSDMHFCWHCIAKNMTPTNIAKILNRFIYKKSCYKIVCEKRKNNSKSKINKKRFIYKKDNSGPDGEKISYYFHKMFKDKNPFDVCRIINKYFLDPRWRFVCKHKKKFFRVKPSYSNSRPNYKEKGY